MNGLAHPGAQVPAASPAVELERWRLNFRSFALLLGLLVLAAFPDVLLGGRTFFYYDFTSIGIGYAQYHRDCFWRGELPLWCPLSNCGIPFMAQWCTLVFYPPALIYLLLPLPWSLSLFTLAHLYFGGLGMYRLALRWTGSTLGAAVAGVAFAFNGMTVNALFWAGISAAISWFPWVVLLMERAWERGGRWLLLAAGAGGLQMLTGAPENILFTWLFAAAIWLGWAVGHRGEFWPSARRWFAVVGMVTGLAAVQLLPFLQLLAHSHRGSDYGGYEWSMPAWGWANFLVPLFYCFKSEWGVFHQYGQFMTASYYAGIGTVALAALAAWRVRQPRVWLLSGLALGCGLLALGAEGHLYKWLRETAPVLGFMRYPVKFAYLLAVLLPVLAAHGVARAEQWDEPARAREGRHWVVLVAAMVVLVGAILWFAQAHPYRPNTPDLWRATWQSGLSRAALLVVTAALVAALGRPAWARWRPWVGLALLVALWFDLWSHTPTQQPTARAGLFAPNLLRLSPPPAFGASRVLLHPQAERFLDAAVYPEAEQDVLARRAAQHGNLNLLDGIPKVSGIHSLYLREMREVFALLARSDDPWRLPLADFLNVSHASEADEPLKWTTRTNFMPLVTAGHRPVFADEQEALRALASADVQLDRVVYLPCEASRVIAATNSGPATVRTESIAAHRLALEVASAAPVLMVVAQAFYPAWKAQVDGRTVPLWRANHAFQALEVPGGKHRVELRYEDGAFRFGLILSALTLLAWTGAWFRFPAIAQASP
jgi:hypothetical protein